jgi:transposase
MDANSSDSLLSSVSLDSEQIADDKSAVDGSIHRDESAGRCPGNHESAGKRRSGKTPAANRHLDAVLTEMAHAAVRTKNSYFKAQYHRLAGRRGKKRALGPPEIIR